MGRKPGKKSHSHEAYRLDPDSQQFIGVLPGGLTIITRRHDAAPLVAVRAYVRAGSALEGRFAGSGISHLLEHVVTGGPTRNHNERELMDLADAIGGLNNAYTSIDHMCYHANVAAENLESALHIISEWVVRPQLSRETFERERGVVMREWESDRDDPQTQLDELLGEVAYHGHPMQFPVIGRMESLKRISHEDLVAFHGSTHTPDGTLIVIVGNIEPASAFQAAAAAFADFEGPASSLICLPEPAPILAPVRAIRESTVDSADVALVWRTLREGAPDDAFLDLLSVALTESDSARWTQSIRWRQSLVFGIGSAHESAWHSPGLFRVSAQLEPDNLAAFEDAVLKELEQLRESPLSHGEVARAQRQVCVAHFAEVQTAEGRAARMGLDFLATGSTAYSDIYIDRIRAATPQELSRVAQQYLLPTARVLAAVVPRTTRRAVSQERTRKLPPLYCGSLSNGGRVLVRPMPSAKLCTTIAVFPGGLRAESDRTNGIGSLLAELMPRGTSQHSADDIAEIFASHGSALRTAGGLDAMECEYASLSEDRESLLATFADVVLNPALAAAELERVRPAICDSIERLDDEWHSDMLRTSMKCFFRNSPYRFLPIGELANVERFTTDDLNAHHRRLITTRAVICVAGPVDADRTVDQLNRAFARLPNPQVEPILSVAPEPEHDRSRLFTKKSSDERQVAAIFVGYPGYAQGDRALRAPFAVFGALLNGYAFSGGRLFAKLRGGKHDMVYEVSGASLVGALPGYVGVMAACQPDRVNEVCSVILAEIEVLKSGRFDDVELERVKQMITAAELDQLQTPADFARRMAHEALHGLPPADSELFLSEVRNVSRDAILQALAGRLVHPTFVIISPDPDRIDIDIPAQPAHS